LLIHPNDTENRKCENTEVLQAYVDNDSPVIMAAASYAGRRSLYFDAVV